MIILTFLFSILPYVCMLAIAGISPSKSFKLIKDCFSQPKSSPYSLDLVEEMSYGCAGFFFALALAFMLLIWACMPFMF